MSPERWPLRCAFFDVEVGARHRINLIAEACDCIERRGLVGLSGFRAGIALPGLLIVHCLLRLLQLLLELVESLCDLALRAIRIWVDSTPQPVCGSLCVVIEVGVVHLSEGIAQLFRDPRLVRGHLTCAVAHTFSSFDRSSESCCLSCAMRSARAFGPSCR